MTAAPPGFGEFVAARGLALQRTALLLTHDVQLAEDLVQTALAKAWPRWKQIDHPESYVRQIIAHEFSRDRRRRWSGEIPTDAPPADAVPYPGEAASTDPTERVAQQDRLIRALRTLPPQQRAVIVLRYFHDQSERQIAEALSISTGSVKAHASRALRALRVSEHFSPEADAPQRIPR